MNRTDIVVWWLRAHLVRVWNGSTPRGFPDLLRSTPQAQRYRHKKFERVCLLSNLTAVTHSHGRFLSTFSGVEDSVIAENSHAQAPDPSIRASRRAPPCCSSRSSSKSHNIKGEFHILYALPVPYSARWCTNRHIDLARTKKNTTSTRCSQISHLYLKAHASLSLILLRRARRLLIVVVGSAAAVLTSRSARGRRR